MFQYWSDHKCLYQYITRISDTWFWSFSYRYCCIFQYLNILWFCMQIFLVSSFFFKLLPCTLPELIMLIEWLQITGDYHVHIYASKCTCLWQARCYLFAWKLTLKHIQTGKTRDISFMDENPIPREVFLDWHHSDTLSDVPILRVVAPLTTSCPDHFLSLQVSC